MRTCTLPCEQARAVSPESARIVPVSAHCERALTRMESQPILEGQTRRQGRLVLSRECGRQQDRITEFTFFGTTRVPHGRIGSRRAVAGPRDLQGNPAATC